MFTVDVTEARQQRARQKAREVSPIVATVEVGSYRVEGSGGDFYDVTVEGEEIGCNCMAGQNDKRPHMPMMCKHLASRDAEARGLSQESY